MSTDPERPECKHPAIGFSGAAKQNICDIKFGIFQRIDLLSRKLYKVNFERY